MALNHVGKILSLALFLYLCLLFLFVPSNLFTLLNSTEFTVYHRCISSGTSLIAVAGLLKIDLHKEQSECAKHLRGVVYRAEGGCIRDNQNDHISYTSRRVRFTVLSGDHEANFIYIHQLFLGYLDIEQLLCCVLVLFKGEKLMVAFQAVIRIGTMNPIHDYVI